MTSPWTPEVVVPPELALELIRTQFPELAVAEASPLGHGWDNTAYLVDGRVVFRFPRRLSTVELLEREAAVLPILAGRLPLPVPAPAWVGHPSAAFEWPFVGYPRLEGRPASEAALAPAQLAAAAPVLGAFLRALHATPVDALALVGDDIGRLDLAARLPVLRERLDTLVARGRIPRPDPWLELFAGEIPGRGPERVLVHGDLYARHLLVDDAGLVSAVIDWGDMHLGDPAVDLSLAWSFLPASARGAFLAAYGEVPASRLRLARLRAASHSISTFWYADAVGDTSLAGAAAAALANVLED